MNDLTAWARQSKGKWNKYAEMKVIYESLIKADIRAAKLKPVKGPVQYEAATHRIASGMV